jgi:hypothetical protein
MELDCLVESDVIRGEIKLDKRVLNKFLDRITQSRENLKIGIHLIEMVLNKKNLPTITLIGRFILLKPR